MAENLLSLKVGEKYEEFKTEENNVLFEWDNTEGMLIIFRINKATDTQRARFLESYPFSFRFCILDNVCFFTINIEGGIWEDMVFSPAPDLYKNVVIEIPKTCDKDKGIPLNLIAFDTRTGELFQIRKIGLGHDFSQKWLDWANNEDTLNMKTDEYNRIAEIVYDANTSVDLARIALEQGNVYDVGVTTQ